MFTKSVAAFATVTDREWRGSLPTPALLPQLDRNVNSGETDKRIEMKLGRQVVVGHCQIVLAWDPSAHAPGQFPWAPFTGLLVDFCHSSNHLSRTFWIINIRLKYFPNRPSDRRLSFLRSCISFLISSLSKMALSTWHNATLFRRIWPQVGRDFNLRRYHHWTTAETYKKLSYRRGTARCVVSVEILPIATQLCRNYLYDKSWTKYQLSLIELRESCCRQSLMISAINDTGWVLELGGIINLVDQFIALWASSPFSSSVDSTFYRYAVVKFSKSGVYENVPEESTLIFPDTWISIDVKNVQIKI